MVCRRGRASGTIALFGLAGGFVGTILMDLVMVSTFVLVGVPGDTFFSMVGERLGGGPALGLATHSLIGLTGGLVYSLAASSSGKLRAGTVTRGVWFGFGAGALTIPLGRIPMAVWLGAPITGVLSFAVLPHLVRGTVMGGCVGYWLNAFGAGNMFKARVGFGEEEFE